MTPSELVLAAFPGRGFVPAVDAGAFLGLAPKTTYNRIHAQDFPVPVRKQGSRVMVSVLDLIRHMEGGEGARKRGRPRKDRSSEGVNRE